MGGGRAWGTLGPHAWFMAATYAVFRVQGLGHVGCRVHGHDNLHGSGLRAWYKDTLGPQAWFMAAT